MRIVAISAYYVIINIVLFVLMRADKIKAQKKQFRIRERNLFIIALLGGAAGGLLGMQIFRHKTQHTSFWVIYIIGFIIHFAAFILLFKDIMFILL